MGLPGRVWTGLEWTKRGRRRPHLGAGGYGKRVDLLVHEKCRPQMWLQPEGGLPCEPLREFPPSLHEDASVGVGWSVALAFSFRTAGQE